ncbi:dienelactone hydrolase family protein [Streptomyces sp. NPDC090106]|uniref:dienelactone hydrolase family protein n=1 Tax=Streptomyces sp. NPDC090106 TaxID=3365946 RepID=UPI0038226A36
MHVISDQLLDDHVRERAFTLDGIPGFLWTPASARATAPVPLILLGHPTLGLPRMYPRLAERARHCAAQGFATATIELPGCGNRPSRPDMDRTRAELRRTLQAGRPVTDDLVDRLVLPLIEQAVPECRAALDTLLALDEIDGPVGCSGGIISLGIRLATTDPRIKAVGLFAGSYIPHAIVEEARRLTLPAHVLLQWDDQGNDRQAALDLFDALGSQEKTLEANMGGHTGVPAHAGDCAARFFTRHLTRTPTRTSAAATG